MSTNFLFPKCPAMFCLYTPSKLSCPSVEFSLKMKVMGSNPDYLLKSFLLYIEYEIDLKFTIFFRGPLTSNSRQAPTPLVENVMQTRGIAYMQYKSSPLVARWR